MAYGHGLMVRGQGQRPTSRFAMTCTLPLSGDKTGNEPGCVRHTWLLR